MQNPAEKMFMKPPMKQEALLRKMTDIYAERALLSGIIAGMINVSSVELSTKDFYDALNREIYKAVAELDAIGKPVDVITVRDRIKNNPVFDDKTYVDVIASDGWNYSEYERIIREQARKRRELSLFEDVKNGKISVEDALDSLHDEPKKSGNEEEYTADDLLAFKEEQKFIAGWPCGYVSVAAGMGGIGKTYLFLKAAGEAAEAGYKVLFWATEDNKYQLRDRLKYFQARYNFDFKNVIFKTAFPEPIIEKSRSGAVTKGAGFSKFKKTIKDSDLIIFDPLMNFGSGIDVIDNTGNRELLNAIRSCMREVQAVVLLHHTNRKQAEKLSIESVNAGKLAADEITARIEKIKGASSIVETCRHVAYVEGNPADDWERVISVIKSNCKPIGEIFNSVRLPENNNQEIIQLFKDINDGNIYEKCGL